MCAGVGWCVLCGVSGGGGEAEVRGVKKKRVKGWLIKVVFRVCGCVEWCMLEGGKGGVVILICFLSDVVFVCHVCVCVSRVCVCV